MSVTATQQHLNNIMNTFNSAPVHGNAFFWLDSAGLEPFYSLLTCRGRYQDNLMFRVTEGTESPACPISARGQYFKIPISPKFPHCFSAQTKANHCDD
jgi:hypothetical protein